MLLLWSRWLVAIGATLCNHCPQTKQLRSSINTNAYWTRPIKAEGCTQSLVLSLFHLLCFEMPQTLPRSQMVT
ncbi:hypothetical protein BU23DRAFT_561003 [Bimuria novae-zelandiae CBS 107.79]|uniref:Secreted protein n=1 Tax=Bimuria novae-zelandiae CBS 107.79 TaxID=1447943 RepID=A0A6A5UL34_9PLEO|nr:hypothetical protein BU23DRAFT_561003 [Bimuria novae-zelandiae CBS 107.79]